MNGQQLLCIHRVLDPASSSAHLHLFERDRLLFIYSSTQVLLQELPRDTVSTNTTGNRRRFV